MTDRAAHLVDHVFPAVPKGAAAVSSNAFFVHRSGGERLVISRRLPARRQTKNALHYRLDS